MSLFDQLAAAKRAVGSILDASRAYRAARQAYDDGCTIPEIVQAFADETDSDLDDEAARHLTELLESVATHARTAGVYAVKLKLRADVQLPKVQNGLDQMARLGARVGDLADRMLGK